MTTHSSPLVGSLVLTFLAITIAVTSYVFLQTEEDSASLHLGTFYAGTNTYILRPVQNPKSCAGSFDVTLETIRNDVTITVRGWTLLSLLHNTFPVETDGTLAFNAIGQLSASVAQVRVNDRSSRLGTLGVNPMTVQVFVGEGNGTLQFEQKIPGPVEIKLHHSKYEIFAPSLPALSSLRSNNTNLPTAPFTLELTKDRSNCSRETAQPFDLTSYIQVVSELSRNIQKVLPIP